MDQPPQDPTQPTPPAPEQPAAPGGWAQPAPPASGPAWGQPAPGQPAPQPQPGPAWGQPATPPQYAPPQPAPGGWAQPAPGGSQWVQPAAKRGPVTAIARLGGLLIAVIGALWIFLGALLIIGGAVSKSLLDNLNAGTDLGNTIGGAIAVFGIVIVVIALFELVAGLAAVFGKDWGRVVSIIYSFVFGVPLLLITLSAATATRNSSVDTDATGALIVLIAHVVAYAFAAIVLMAKWRGRATA